MDAARTRLVPVSNSVHLTLEGSPRAGPDAGIQGFQQEVSMPHGRGDGPSTGRLSGPAARRAIQDAMAVVPSVVSKIELWKPEQLIPLERKPRVYSDEQIGEIAISMREFGFLWPRGAGVYDCGSSRLSHHDPVATSGGRHAAAILPRLCGAAWPRACDPAAAPCGCRMARRPARQCAA